MADTMTENSLIRGGHERVVSASGGLTILSKPQLNF